MFTRRVEIKSLIVYFLLVTVFTQCADRYLVKPFGYWPITAYEHKLFIRSETKLSINKKLEKFIRLKWYLFQVNSPSKYYALDSIFYGIITLCMAILHNPERLL